MAITRSVSGSALRTSWCDACSAPTRLVHRLNGLPIELDARPHPNGTVIPVKVRGVVVAQVLTLADLARYSGSRWMPHRAVCPADVEVRQPAGRGSRLQLSGFCCLDPGCRQPLPVVLLEIGELTHPACELPLDVALTSAQHRRTA